MSGKASTEPRTLVSKQLRWEKQSPNLSPCKQGTQRGRAHCLSGAGGAALRRQLTCNLTACERPGFTGLHVCLTLPCLGLKSISSMVSATWSLSQTHLTNKKGARTHLLRLHRRETSAIPQLSNLGDRG